MKKYVLVGTGWRGTMAYLEPMVKEYADCADLVAVCDPNESRATYVTEYIGKKGLPVYTDFDQMLKVFDSDALNEFYYYPEKDGWGLKLL